MYALADLNLSTASFTKLAHMVYTQHRGLQLRSAALYGPYSPPRNRVPQG